MAKKESKNENKVKKHFFKDFKAELKKVIWPSPKQLTNNTVAVITIVLLAAIIVFTLDVVFDLGNKYGITNLQSIVNEKFNSKDDESKDAETKQEDGNVVVEGDKVTEDTDKTDGNSVQ